MTVLGVKVVLNPVWLFGFTLLGATILLGALIAGLFGEGAP